MSDFQLKIGRSQPHLDWSDKDTEESAENSGEDSVTHRVVPQASKKDDKDPGNIPGSVFAGLSNGIQTAEFLASFATRGTSEATGPRLNLPLFPLPKFNHHRLLMNKEQGNFFARWDLLLSLAADARVIFDYVDPQQLDTRGGLGLGLTAAKDLADMLALNNLSRGLITDVNLHNPSSHPLEFGYRAVVFVDGAFKLINSSQVARRQYTADDFGCTPYQAQNGCRDEDIRDAGNNTGSIVENYFGTADDNENDAQPDADGLPSTLLAVHQMSVSAADASRYLASYQMSKALENPDGRPGPQGLLGIVPAVADGVITSIQAQKDGKKIQPGQVIKNLALAGAASLASSLTTDPRVDIANVNNGSYLAWSFGWPKILGLTNTHSGLLGEGQYDNPNSIFNLTPLAVGGLYLFNSFQSGAEAGYALSLNKRFENFIPLMLGVGGLAAQWIGYAQNPNEKVASTLGIGTGLYFVSGAASFALSKLIQSGTGTADPFLATARDKPLGKKSLINFNPSLGIGPDGVHLGVTGTFK